MLSVLRSYRNSRSQQTLLLPYAPTVLGADRSWDLLRAQGEAPDAIPHPLKASVVLVVPSSPPKMDSEDWGCLAGAFTMWTGHIQQDPKAQKCPYLTSTLAPQAQGIFTPLPFRTRFALDLRWDELAAQPPLHQYVFKAKPKP